MTNTKQWQPNAKQQQVINFLKENDGAYTLAEIATALNIELKSGTTNVLIGKGLIKCNKDALTKVCPHCGHKTKLSTYEIAK